MRWPDVIAAIAVALLEWAIKQGAKPRTLEDANTPADIRDRWADWIAKRLRKQDGGHQRQ